MSTTVISTDFIQDLSHYIDGGIREYIKEAYDKKKQELIDELDAARDKYITEMALRMSSYMDIQTDSRHVTIRIEKPHENN